MHEHQAVLVGQVPTEGSTVTFPNLFSQSSLQGALLSGRSRGLGQDLKNKAANQGRSSTS